MEQLELACVVPGCPGCDYCRREARLRKAVEEKQAQIAPAVEEAMRLAHCVRTPPARRGPRIRKTAETEQLERELDELMVDPDS